MKRCRIAWLRASPTTTAIFLPILQPSHDVPSTPTKE
jgi:hypothetical protein